MLGKTLVDGQDANLNQVEFGLAWHDKTYEKEQRVADRQSYAQAELDARRAHIGLWRDTNPIPPRDYRHGTGEAASIRKVLLEQNCPCGSGTSCTGPKGEITAYRTQARKGISSLTAELILHQASTQRVISG